VTPRAPAPARPVAWHAAAVVLAAAVCYANVLHAPFVLDDDTSIVLNPSIGSWEILPRFEPPTRRVAYTTFTLNHALGGLDPFGYHLFNVGVHALAGLAVYALARLLLRAAARAGGEGSGDGEGDAAGWAPLAAALLFVVHPLQTQAVTYVTQRIASLATLLYVGALALYAWARAEGPERPLARRLAWGGALLSALLATFTKEIAFTLPLAVALLEVAFFRGPGWRRLAAGVPFLLLLPIIPLQLAGAGRPIAEVIADVHDVARADSSLPRAAYLATQARVIAAYLRLAALPAGQNLDHDFPVERSLASPAVLASAAALAALAALGAWLLWRGRRAGARVAGAGIMLFFLALAVESGVPIADVMFEHRMYLPMAGLALAAAGALSVAAARFPGARRGLAVAVGAALVALAAATVARNALWRDPVALWADAVAKSPAKPRPRYNLGTVLLERGDLAAAEREWLEVVRLDPAHSWALNQLGSVALTRRDLSAAEAWYRRAIATPWVNPEAFYNLALVLEATGRAVEAAPAYRRFYDLAPLGRAREREVLRRRFGWR